MSMRVCAVGEDLGVLVRQQGEFLDLFGWDVQRAGDVRFAITFGAGASTTVTGFLSSLDFKSFVEIVTSILDPPRRRSFRCQRRLARFLRCLKVVYVVRAHLSPIAQPTVVLPLSGERGDDLAKLLFCKSAKGLAADIALHSSS